MSSSNFTVRMPDELRKKLEERAEEEGRTLSNLVIFLLKKAVGKNENR